MDGQLDRRQVNRDAIAKRFEKENRILKELLAEKELEAKMKDELLKKVCSMVEKREIIYQYVSRGLPVLVACRVAAMSKSTHYYLHNLYQISVV